MHVEPDVEYTGPIRRRRTPQKPRPTRPTRPTIDPQAEMTLDEIGTELGVTRERVRQILSGALLKAEKILRARGYGLREFMDAMERSRNGERL